MQIIDENSGETRATSPWISIGRVYHVLSVYLDQRKVVLVRMIGDDQTTPALYGLNQFEIVSPRIPSNWIVNWEPSGIMEFAPAKWLVEGFWERYFDGEPEAIRLFSEDRKKIEEEDP